MTKAEEKALQIFPSTEKEYESKFGTFHFDDLNVEHREGFVVGYEQAEKDHELTIKDLELLHTFLYAVKNNKQGAFTFTKLSDEQYQEVLKRFKEAKR